MPDGQSQATAPDNLTGSTLCDGEYRIEKVLGHGGMGKVYLAVHTSLGMQFAIKQVYADQPLPESVVTELDHVLHGYEENDHLARKKQHLPALQEKDFPSSGGIRTDRFLREALLLAHLEHPAIPMLYDYFSEGGYWYLVMDYIPGLTLSKHLRRHGPLQPLAALGYAMQICAVLDYLHRQTPPIIYRDVKPSNIILTPGGLLMLVDFGIARYFKAGYNNDTIEFGSPGYAPPEQYQSGAQTDARSDLYSLGILLHEMITGKHPPDLGTPLEDVQALNPAISPALSGLIALATRAEPDQRFQSAQAFYLALERISLTEEWRVCCQYLDDTTAKGALASSGLRLPAPVKAKATHESVRKIENNAEPGTRVLIEEACQPGTDPPQITGPLEYAPDAHHTDYHARNTGQTATGNGEHASSSASWSLPVEQRRQIRRAIMHARQQRLEEEQLERQFASIDENLERRSLASFPRITASQIAQKEQDSQEEQKERDRPVFSQLTEVPRSSLSQSQPRPRVSRVERGLQVSFALALLLLLLFSSFFMFWHPRQPENASILPFAPQTTPLDPTSVWTGVAWKTLPSLPATEADNTAVYVQANDHSYIYMTGGYHGPKQAPHYDHSLYRYDVLAARWEAANERLPGMLNNAAAVDNQGHIFFTAGYSTDTYAVVSALYRYQVADNTIHKITPAASMTIGFGGSLLADMQGHLYLTQGFLQAGRPAAHAGAGWYRYDIAAGTWRQLAPLPQGLGYTILAPDGNGGILLLGGSIDAGQHMQSSQIYRYDIAENSWQILPGSLPYPLSGAASCVALPDHLAVIGGYDAGHNQGYNQSWLVNLRSLRWTPLPSLPSGGSVLGNAACDGSGTIFLQRGADKPDQPTRDFWQLTLPPAVLSLV
ncbi:MAG: protein kinase [Ktedonobacteraceae bacterium]|nr:protein kinase [Ktedonobacteraceae bacterium]